MRSPLGGNRHRIVVALAIVSATCSEPTARVDDTAVVTSIVATSALTQSAIVTTVVPSNPTVRVVDQHGRPMVGVVVLFSGRTSGTQDVTSADGLASTTWRLDAVAGSQSLVASVRGSKVPPITFAAAALADSATAMNASVLWPQAGIASSPAPSAPAVIVTDAFQNGKAGIEVTFEIGGGGGSVTPATVVTDADGRAAVARPASLSSIDAAT